MKPCPKCGTPVTPGASNCSKCGAIIAVDIAVLAPTESVSVKVPQNKAALARWSSAALGVFTVIAVIWPFTSLGALFLFDSPRAGGLFVWLLFYSTVLYGPIYVFALLLARSLEREGDALGALTVWLCLCGSDVAIWSISFFVIEAFCSGEFRCP